MLFTLLLPLVTGVGGVLLGAWLASRRDRVQRRLSFMERQLSEFYSPLLGLRAEISAQSVLRVRIQREAEAAWIDRCESVEQAGGRPTADPAQGVSRIIDYDNQKFREDLLPAYREMLRVFREKYWLADPDTRGYFEPLITFVEIWNRWTSNALPPEVIARLGHTEANLDPFYDHLRERHDRIRARIEAGAP